MRTVTVTEAKATLSQILEQVLAGEQIAIGRRGAAEVVLVAISRSDQPREFGGVDIADYWMSDEFDEPLPDIEEAFDPG